GGGRGAGTSAGSRAGNGRGGSDRLTAGRLPGRVAERACGVGGRGSRRVVPEQKQQSVLEFRGLEPEGAPAALVGNLALAVDQVEPPRQAAVAGADAVVHRGDQHRGAEAERRAAALPGRGARSGAPALAAVG